MLKMNFDENNVLNFVSAMNYLKHDLQNIDVSDDFAADENDNVNAYQLLTNNEFYETIMNYVDNLNK